MSDAHGEGGGSGKTIFLIIISIVVVWALAHGSGTQQGLFGNNDTAATSSGNSFFSITPLFKTDTQDSGSYTSREPDTTAQEYISDAQTRSQIESHISDAGGEVQKLKEDMRVAKIWGVISPYRDMVTFSSGNAWSDDPKTEYLLLSVHSDTIEPIDVTDWRIESLVTGNTARISFGTRLPRSGRVNTTDRIRVDANETAYILTGESPLGVSFFENKCTGYFAQYQRFSPPLTEQCPYPLDELKNFSTIDLDNDDCYTVVQSLPACRVTNEDATSPTVSRGCKEFIANDLTYSGCVANHRTEPFFYTGPWRIYLEEDNELWRTEREIIRVRDGQNRTVAVLEY